MRWKREGASGERVTKVFKGQEASSSRRRYVEGMILPCGYGALSITSKNIGAKVYLLRILLVVHLKVVYSAPAD